MKKRRCDCEVEGCDRLRKGTNRVCSYHLGVHDPVPDHHVAQARACIRCGEDFESTWAGDRVCGGCRAQARILERQAISRGLTLETYDSPFEPDGIPGIGA